MNSFCEDERGREGDTDGDFLDITLTPPRKISKCSKNIKHRKQKFRDAWLKNEDFKQWLSKVPQDQLKAKCVSCNILFNAELTVIKNHMTSKTHIDRLKPQEQLTIGKFMTNNRSSEKVTCPKTRAVQALEIKLCGFVAEHNISFVTLNHLTLLLKSAVPDSDILRSIQLKATKGTAIIKNVIAASEKTQLQKKLQTCLFSVLIDESTDIGGIQTLCVIVRFFDTDERRVVGKFWKLCQVFDQNSDVEGATAEHLFKLLTKSFEEYDIPLENIIGFASDGASTMMGANNSVASRLIEQCPGIYIFKCLCHSLHLCASNACKKLPRSCEDLARNIYGEFKNSAKRQHLFENFQTFLEIDVHKILRPAQTRWLSLRAVVSRIIEQWPALELYFRQQLQTIRLKSVEQIVQALNNPINKLLYLFLDYILPKFTTLNELFQSTSVVITSLYEKMCRNFQELLESYMSRDYIHRTNLAELDPCNRTHFLRPENMYLGIEVRKMLDHIDIRNNSKLKSDFASICVDFLMEGCSEIKKRFNFSDPVLKLVTNLNPSKAIMKKTRDVMPSLLPLMESLPRGLTCTPMTPNGQLQIIDDEWRQLPFFQLPADIDIKDPIDVFWEKLMNCEEGEQGMTFRNVSKFVLNVISLPHSNADSERIFSKIKLIKTKNRNKTTVSTVNGILLAKQRVKAKNTDCTTYEPSQSKFSRMNKGLMYKKTNTASKSTENKICELYGDPDVDEFNGILMPNED